MKRIVIILTLFAAVQFSSCNYLDVIPEGTPTLDDAFRSEDKALTYLYSIYGHLPNNIQYWMPGQPCGGDDLATSCKGTTRWFCYKSMVYGEETSSVLYHNFMQAAGSPTGGTSYDIYTGIRYCHTLLDRIHSVPDISPTNLREWQGEAYYLLGYFHWILLEYYGPIVLVREETPLDAPDSDLFQPRNTFDECVTYIAECLDKAAEMLPPRQSNAKWYGRGTVAGAYALKTRLMLFAASPLFNGNTEFYSGFTNPDGTHLVNQSYDRNKWKLAMDAAKTAIDYAEANGYKLYENPANATIGDTFERGVKNFHDYFVEPEYNTDEYLIAFVHPSSNNKVQQKSGLRSTFPYTPDGFNLDYQVLFPAAEMYYTRNGLPLDVDPLTRGRDLYSYDPTAETAVLNLDREPRFYACVSYNRGEFEIDNQVKTVRAYAGEEHGFTMANGTMDMTREYNNSTGYLFKKPIHRTTAYDKTTKAFTYKRYVYPVIRLAELYLSYAEADFEYNGSLSELSLSYLDKVRKRCGLPKFRDSWAMAGGIPSGEELRRVLHMERNNELMFEGHRYRDMRRWKEAEECMTRMWKAWNVGGTTAATYYKVKDFSDFDSKTRVFRTPQHYLLPIPLSEIEINSNLVQNPGW